MADKKWTENQKRAIEARKGTVLISAAAGSGKTAVLVQRVTERITDKNNPCDADKLLIVTFTNAAAAEMRERIAEKIAELISEKPYDRNLQRQQILFKRAKISTIHSFCNDIVRENFFRLDISQDFRISDENEMSILRKEAIKNVLDHMYSEGNPDFFQAIEQFSNEKNDNGFENAVMSVYDFVRAYPFPEKWFEEKSKMYDTEGSIKESPWGKIIVDYVCEAINHSIKSAERCLDIARRDDQIFEKYSQTIRCDIQNLEILKYALKNGTWDDFSEKLKVFSFERWPACRKCQNELIKNKIKDIRDKAVKKNIDSFKKYFMLSESETKKHIKGVYSVVNQLFRATELFDTEINRLKRKRNCVDFGDLEHLALKLLTQKDGAVYKRSDIAKELSNRFEEIMVDEYQDTNEAQDTIFKMISKNEKNIFMVGDVKQSIYSFRQAMPEIFLRKKDEYPLYDPDKDNYPAAIILDKNFRSRAGVINAVNFVFSRLMSPSVGGINYTEEEALSVGANYAPSESPEMCIKILEKPKDAQESDDTYEARSIARTIAEMIGSGYKIKDGDKQRPVTYRDFCILLRSTKKHAPTYVKELCNLGIPAWSEVSSGFFGTYEVSVMVSLLRVIDNPVQDIPLLSVLVSPIFGFSADDLSDIRIAQRNGPIYFAIKKLAEKGDKRCTEFFDLIDNLRQASSSLTCGQLINYIYENTGLMSAVRAMENGNLRIANLRMLAEYAYKYDGKVYKGLSGFIRFIDRLQEQKSDLASESALSATSNVVRIMSIHKSKGLEFPICIIANCSKKFNLDRGEPAIHSELGLGLRLKDKTGVVRYEGLPSYAVSLERNREQISEELRILYVAMTRAKEKLIIQILSEDIKKTLSNVLNSQYPLSPFSIRRVSNFSQWILACALVHPSGEGLRDLAESFEFIPLTSDNENKWEIIINPNTEEPDENQSPEEESFKYKSDICIEKIKKRFDYIYPYECLKSVPVKMAASRMAQEGHWQKYIAVSRPSFMIEEKVKASEKGTAIHEFLCFADFEQATNDLEGQINYLRSKGFLSKEQTEYLDREAIHKFLSSDLGKRIRKSKELFKEYRFTVRMDAGETFDGIEENASGEMVLVQGAIDCVFEENGSYAIVDYKTDKIKDISQLAEMYAYQLEIYKYALEKCEEKSVSDLIIYSFNLGKWIKV